MGRLSVGKPLAILVALFVVAALSSCSKPGDEQDPPPPGGEAGELYMHTGSDGEQGLFRLDMGSGAATKLGFGIVFQTGASDVGLAGRGPNQPLLGTDYSGLYSVPTTGASPSSISASCPAQGLAYDVDNDRLYLTLSSAAKRVDPHTCADIETLSTSHALGGLAIDSASQTLYGIGEADGNLYALDLAAGAPYAWTAVFDTGVSGWDDPGLAFDAADGVLYAVGHPTDKPGLYRIDLAAGTIERVGDTGISTAYGGLAWRYED